MKPSLLKALDRVFNPRSIAVFGDSAKYGFVWLNSLKQFKGKRYAIQLNKDGAPAIRALGAEFYTSILDVPEPVDYAIVAVPRKAVPQVLSECMEKQVGGVAIFAAGFAELDEEGAALQKSIADMAGRSNTLVLGPNCMGIYRPDLGLRFDPSQPVGRAGEVGFISQSGFHTATMTVTAAQHGLETNKAVSIGNGALVEAADFLEYFSMDPGITMISAYIEGVRDGVRFLKAAREAAWRKPLLIWKGGRTPSGQRAAASHTGALATNQAIWNTAIRQAGAVQVESMDEIIDTMRMFQQVKPPKGNRLGLLASAGGQSVVIDDAFAEQGLEVPMLSEASYRQMGAFFDPIGGSYQNPIDLSRNFYSVDVLEHVLRILIQDDHIDAIALELSLHLLERRKLEGKRLRDQVLDLVACFRKECPKPFFTIITSAYLEREALDLRDELTKRGVATFPSFQRAAKAYRLAWDYYHNRNGGA